MTEQRTKVFWEIALTYAGSNEALIELSKTIAHCCYRNYDMSKRIAKMLLVGLNKCSIDEVRPFAMAMKWYLTIKDEF